MKTSLLIFGLFIGCFTQSSIITAESNTHISTDYQQDSTKKEDYLAVPEGGRQALMSHIGKVLQWPQQYPDFVGKVFLSFEVNVITGELSDVNILKGSSENKAFQEEAVRLLTTGPKWEVISKTNSGKMPAKVSKIIMIKFDGVQGNIGIGGI